MKNVWKLKKCLERNDQALPGSGSSHRNRPTSQDLTVGCELSPPASRLPVRESGEAGVVTGLSLTFMNHLSVYDDLTHCAPRSDKGAGSKHSSV